MHQNWVKWGVKPAVFLACLTPLLVLGWNAINDHLSANPIDDITDATGTWTLRFLLVTLSITPVRKLTGLNTLIRFRRMIGLFAFFYACLHFTTYIWLDQSLQFDDIIKDIPKRPFITVGFTAFGLLIPLAVTSTKGMIRRLGGKRWNILHKLIYLSAICGVIHYYWLVKADKQRPLVYGAILAILLGYRLLKSLRSRFSGNSQEMPQGVTETARPGKKLP
jgi:methionine sulfoxide reductase heme-binding subunit